MLCKHPKSLEEPMHQKNFRANKEGLCSLSKKKEDTPNVLRHLNSILTLGPFLALPHLNPRVCAKKPPSQLYRCYLNE